MLSARFCYGEQRAVLAVKRDTQLRHVQENLCRLFGQRFPAMKACLHIDGRDWDEFGDTPFAGHDDKVGKLVGKVKFIPTDDPFFYDVADRVGPKGTVEDEILYDEAEQRGITMPSYKDWLRSRRAREVLRPLAWIGASYMPFAEGAKWGDDADRTVLSCEVWPPWDPATSGFDVAFLPPWEEMRKDGA